MCRQDISNAQVGKTYRGSLVKKIKVETTNLDDGKVKTRRTIHMEGGLTCIETIVHEKSNLDENGVPLPAGEVAFPSMEPEEEEDFDTWLRIEREKIEKDKFFRKKAREMMQKRRLLREEFE